ncbi:MAG TPA: dihydrofolate reductase family protein [Candidatus Limnocylindrales bacterium]|nr:dihydrofolate reductase family protein [Candidatus Limnocylindrales bacterium]
MTDLQHLWDAAAESGPSRGDGMPGVLRARYGGELTIPVGTDRPTLLVNFVTSLDGVVALAAGEEPGGGVISGRFEPDRFVMALLRAVSDVVLVGAGTIAGGSNHQWTADHLAPELAPAFGEWRRRLGLARQPTTAIVTGSGEVRLGRRGLDDRDVPVVFLTTPRGAGRLAAQQLPSDVAVEVVGRGDGLEPEELGRWLATRRGQVVLSEGGPHLMGGLVSADVVDEYFLTVAPQVLGRGGDAAGAVAGRFSMVEGTALSPGDSRWHELVSVKRAEDHLFLRYRRRGLRNASPAPAP